MGDDNVSWLSHASQLTVAYLRDGEDGLADIEAAIGERAHDRPGEKFSKSAAGYLPQSPVLPNAWRESCGRCRFWREGSPGEPGGCHVVGLPGDGYGGEAIHPKAWCKLWMPPRHEPAFAWLFEQLGPTGADLVRGEYHAERRDTEQTTIGEAVERGGEADDD